MQGFPVGVVDLTPAGGRLGNTSVMSPITLWRRGDGRRWPLIRRAAIVLMAGIAAEEYFLSDSTGHTDDVRSLEQLRSGYPSLNSDDAWYWADSLVRSIPA
jgi:hypothetical protein